MTHLSATQIPDQVVAGTQVYWKRQASSEFLPADGWGLTLFLAGQSYLSKAFTAVSNYFEITLTAAETAAIAKGPYLWEERLIKGSEKYRFSFGSIEVLPDLGAATAGSLESRTAKMLRAIRAAIDIRMGIGGAGIDLVDAYSIGTRSFTKVPLEDLMSLESKLAMQLKREANPGKWGPTIEIRFPSISSGFGG